jgi:DNA-binding response OmpR family regulator
MFFQIRPLPVPETKSVFSGSPRKRVLCVDDHNDIAALIRVMLSLRGFEVIVANSCDQARKTAGSEPFDLFLLDSRLPDGSGVDLCREIHELYPETPVVFFSGVAFESERRRGVQAGASEYLIKPNDLERLGRTVELYTSNTVEQPGNLFTC